MSKKYLITSVGTIICILLATDSYQIAYQKFAELDLSALSTEIQYKKEVKKDKVIANSIFNYGCEAYSSDNKFKVSTRYIASEGDTSQIHNGYTELLLTDLKTNDIKVITQVSYASCPRIWSSSNIYLSVDVYEGIGSVAVIDLNDVKSVVKKIEFGSTVGHLSPDLRYYVFPADTKEKNGAQFCTSPATNDLLGSASSIRILDIKTGKVDIIKSDENIIYDIMGWSEDSKEVYFDEDKLSGKIIDGCPEFDNSITKSVYSINIFTKKITKRINNQDVYSKEGFYENKKRFME